MEATYSEKKKKSDMKSIANSGTSHSKYHEKQKDVTRNIKHVRFLTK